MPPLPGVKSIVAVASGKGGVGKSTLTANLALALAASGLKVGVLDADVYGPSIPTILGATERPTPAGEGRIKPVERYGVKVISTGFFLPPNDAVIWRGPMLHKMVQDLLSVVEWGALDVLLVDLPPGTGDVQLSLCQSVPLSGAVIVSTPQDVAWNVAQKAIVMFDKLNTPVLGVVENMSHYECAHCGGREEIFGSGGARRAAARLGIPFLGEVPLLTAVRRTADAGDPVVHSDPDGAAARAFRAIADGLLGAMGAEAARDKTKIVPVKFGAFGEKDLQIVWSDAAVTSHDPRELRLACPCAGCVNEATGERTLDPASVRSDVRVAAAGAVGRYALALAFSDGHNPGLYSLGLLRAAAAAPKR